jgi:hypothetical protein
MTGITMLDESIVDVREQNPGNDSAIREALMKKIQIYNYVPPGVENAYAQAIMEEFKKSVAKK